MHLSMCMNVCLRNCTLAHICGNVAMFYVYICLKSVHMSIYGCVYCKRMRFNFLCVCV